MSWASSEIAALVRRTTIVRLAGGMAQSSGKRHILTAEGEWLIGEDERIP